MTSVAPCRYFERPAPPKWGNPAQAAEAIPWLLVALRNQAIIRILIRLQNVQKVGKKITCLSDTYPVYVAVVVLWKVMVGRGLTTTDFPKHAL
jgi:hypothetical protein